MKCSNSSSSCDIVVVGGGHAGCEAALAAARLGARTALVTASVAALSRMSCNPSIGGLAKGHLAREVDALGGVMGQVGDATGLQFRRLNLRKGAAVRATRVQSDKARYSAMMQALVTATAGLAVCEGEVAGLTVHGERVTGVTLSDGTALRCRAVVLTTGTFLRGLLHVGLCSRPGGRDGEPAANALSAALGALGLTLGRLKTGTPCRLAKDSIDYGRLEQQPGDDPPPRLSFYSAWPAGRPPLPQLPCHVTYTNPRTHEIIRRGLDRSPLYSGKIVGVGPRYCPSIEDKVVRFADRDRHQLFIEPEGLDSELVYPGGISTSLPEDVQEALVHSIVGLEHARLVRPGYAVEYDFAPPQQLFPSLESKAIAGLYLAGQINGTSGYEEAASQGLVAGINAARSLDDGKPPLILRRDQAYIGVLIDDLTTLGTEEPYRMFTSRAEYRLLLREDNADSRLTPIGREVGLIDDEKWATFCAREEQRERLRGVLTTGRTRPVDGEVAERFVQAGTSPPRPGTPLDEVLRRPELGLEHLRAARWLDGGLTEDPFVAEPVELDVKYAGYIERQRVEAERMQRLEHTQLPRSLCFEALSGLSNEVRQKLAAVQPLTLGQAGRIPGVTPAAVAILEVHLRGRT